jgi:hypothetical protein
MCPLELIFRQYLIFYVLSMMKPFSTSRMIFLPSTFAVYGRFILSSSSFCHCSYTSLFGVTRKMQTHCMYLIYSEFFFEGNTCMIKFLRNGVLTEFNITKAFTAGQLCQTHHQELLPGYKLLNLIVTTVFVNAFTKLMPGSQ